MVNDFLLLKKDHQKNRLTPPNEYLLDSKFKLKKNVKISNINGKILFAEIDIEPTIFGKLFSLMFKPSQLRIVVTLSDSSIRSYRISSVRTESGFVISPLIEDAIEFSMLYDKDKYSKLLNDKKVESFTISAKNKSFLWKKIID